MRVERLCREFGVELDVWAYNLRPGIPAQGLPRDEVYKHRQYPPGYVERLRQTAKESGIEMITPPVVANTFKAHEATEFAREGGRLPAFHRAVFAAYWERGENIGEAEGLCAEREQGTWDQDQRYLSPTCSLFRVPCSLIGGRMEFRFTAEEETFRTEVREFLKE